MLRFIKIGILSFTLLISAYATADEALVKRKDVQAFITKMVKEHHFNRNDVVLALKQAQYQPQIIESMDKPFEKKTWDIYRDLFLTPQRLQAGIEFWQQNQDILHKAEQQYGVPADIIVAIIGVETLYGKHQGNYRVLDALTTLAFYYPKREVFFKKELIEYLLLCREHDVSPTNYLGSYAGAIGKPQFMPSSYRFYAIDFTGKGTRDLINDDKDVIASVANYFHKHGWKINEAVAQPARVSGWRYKQIQTNSRAPNYDLKRLMAAGIKPDTSPPHYLRRAGLIELTTEKGQEFWLAYPNFYVITHYNTSPQYALVVYLLAQQLRSQINSAPVREDGVNT
jgi:membrane-bound lytic murein transglycosylase B